jgi:hypothetical protein
MFDYDCVANSYPFGFYSKRQAFWTLQNFEFTILDHESDLFFDIETTTDIVALKVRNYNSFNKLDLRQLGI